MRIIGLRRPHGGSGVEVAALADGDNEVTVIASLADFWADPAGHLSRPPAGPTLATSLIEQVPPVPPDARVICIGLNYQEHAAEGSYRDQDLPPYPTLFARWTKSLTVNGAEIPVPANEDGLDWEGEVVAWVGAPLVDASPEEALASVIGYSTFNDLTARKAQKRTSQWTLGKNADSSGPIGPMVPAADVGDLRQGLRLRTRVNGETVQDAYTNQMMHTVGDTLSLISHTLSLRPGDLLATGTPAGVGYARTPPQLLQPGDTVEVEVDRLGVLRNAVVGNDRRYLGKLTLKQSPDTNRSSTTRSTLDRYDRATKCDLHADSVGTHLTREKPMTLEELSARAQIHDVLLRYCRGLDRVDMNLVRGAFHKDAWVQFPKSLHVGSLDGFVEFLTEEMPRFVRTMHVLGNSLIEFDGPNIAHVETYLNADHQASDRHHWKGDYVKLWARYLDRFEQRDGVWLIARRMLLVDWMYKYPANGWFDDHPDASVGLRDGTDPSLRRVAGFDGTPLTKDVWPS